MSVFLVTISPFFSTGPSWEVHCDAEPDEDKMYFFRSTTVNIVMVELWCSFCSIHLMPRKSWTNETLSARLLYSFTACQRRINVLKWTEPLAYQSEPCKENIDLLLSPSVSVCVDKDSNIICLSLCGYFTSLNAANNRFTFVQSLKRRARQLSLVLLWTNATKQVRSRNTNDKFFGQEKKNQNHHE